MKKLIASKHALYDPEREKWSCAIGIDTIEGEIVSIVYADSEPKAIELAKSMVAVINGIIDGKDHSHLKLFLN